MIITINLITKTCIKENIFGILQQKFIEYQEDFLINDIHLKKFDVIDDYIVDIKNELSNKSFDKIKKISVSYIQDNIKKTLKLSV